MSESEEGYDFAWVKDKWNNIEFSQWQGWNLFTLIIYIGAIVALYFAFILEYKDLYCPKEGQIAAEGNGAAYSEGKPFFEDDKTTLLKKIRISSRYDEASVYWRRTIIFSLLLSFVLLVLVLKRFPDGYEVITSFTVIYLFTFLFLVFYQETVSKKATNQVSECINLLERKF